MVERGTGTAPSIEERRRIEAERAKQARADSEKVVAALSVWTGSQAWAEMAHSVGEMNRPLPIWKD